MTCDTSECLSPAKVPFLLALAMIDLISVISNCFLVRGKGNIAKRCKPNFFKKLLKKVCNFQKPRNFAKKKMKEQFTWMDIPIDRRLPIGNKIKINPCQTAYAPDYAHLLGKAMVLAEQLGWQDWLIREDFLIRTA